MVPGMYSTVLELFACCCDAMLGALARFAPNLQIPLFIHTFRSNFNFIREDQLELVIMPYPNRVFGQAMKKQSRYQRQFGGKTKGTITQSDQDSKAEEVAARRRLRQQQGEIIDVKFGYKRLEDQLSSDSTNQPIIQRRGWLFNMLATTVSDILSS